MNWKKIILCYIFSEHNWTCKAMEEIQPTEEEAINLEEGFKSYAKMYCKRCGKESKLNLK